MKKAKNQLLLVCLLLYMLCLPCIGAHGAVLPTSGLINDVSEKLVLSLENNPIKIELPYIYVPTNLQEFAGQKLKELALGKLSELEYVTNLANRNGHFPAIVKINKQSLQEQLISNGAALVYFVDIAENSSAFFTSEKAARKANLGIWQNSNFNILDSNKIEDAYKKHLGNFLIVEGVVDNIYISKKNVFLNFGADWQTDFTIQLDNKSLKQFPNFDPEKLTGKSIRARGWLENYNGPFMKIFNVQNIEIE